ncbi:MULTISPECIES: hypothetical protein [unclassified Peribacillus]|uniref:hypothetical protein n=1 Tax=unclassified Peribacillus TaxID=2675266 RepID=UPI00191393E0|nr:MULTISPECIES: hypothetical protein [unclassified Peribacillus]MBK5446689.1 hypothetical protein [Peribacillus sp. TH24]MBK5502970.1 hypothetical protein [Peribacillus sp. TH14]WMX58903.1 hypothetical protein RE409_29635 [Peribacillus sp. R9-11]
MLKEKLRSTRSDKKRDVRPTIPVTLKECIYRISYITNTPVKDVCVDICEAGVVSKKVMEHMSVYFRRQIWLDQTLYRGDLANASIKSEIPAGQKERITMRFSQRSFENIRTLGYALDVTPTTAVALLLDASVKNSDFINEYVRIFLSKHVDEGRMRELKQVMTFINKNNPYEEQISWSTITSFIVDEMKIGTSNLSQSINGWLDKLK